MQTPFRQPSLHGTSTAAAATSPPSSPKQRGTTSRSVSVSATATATATAAVVNALLSPLAATLKGATTNNGLPLTSKRKRRHRSEHDDDDLVIVLDDTNDETTSANSTMSTSCCDQLSQRIPIVGQVRDRMNRIPPKYKYFCFLCWLSYKLLSVVLVLWLVHENVGSSSSSSHHFTWLSFLSHHRIRGASADTTAAASRMALELSDAKSSSTLLQSQPKTRVLYIVTSLAEFNNGRRNTIAGQDRLGEVVVPILVDSVRNILETKRATTKSSSGSSSSSSSTSSYQVDVYLILAFSLRPERRDWIRSLLPPSVGLEVWDDACPLGYDPNRTHKDVIADNTRALARQHRYVIKDKLPYYDVFVAFEDDMRITGAHVEHYLYVSYELERLRLAAAAAAANGNANSATSDSNAKDAADAGAEADSFFGPLTSRQWDRLIPGFVRVEVLLDEAEHGAQLELDPIPLDYSYDGVKKEVHFDAQPCCHVPKMKPRGQTPPHPPSSDVVVWETSVKALAVRQLSTSPALTSGKNKDHDDSTLDWVAFLPGPGKRLLPKDLIGSFWSGRLSSGKWDVRPSPGQPDLIAQQGGWMATQQQIMRWNQQVGDNTDNNEEEHPQLCQGTFLPPFDDPVYRQDGQESMNVEFWSGGYQLFTGVKGGCNMLRVLSLQPEHFSKHFIYHVANNKQKQLSRQRMVRADHLWGQLNSVRKAAIVEMQSKSSASLAATTR